MARAGYDPNWMRRREAAVYGSFGKVAAMPYLIGVDEAGYGPNLGPLVIAATAWRVPRLPVDDLYDVLVDAVSRDAAEAAATGRLAIADSKVLYNPQRGLGDLERGVLAALLTTDVRPAVFHDLLAAIQAPADASTVEMPTSSPSRRRGRSKYPQLIPWHESDNEPLPVAAEAADCAAVALKLTTALHRAEMGLVGIRAAMIQPERFNDLVDEHDGKGGALSETTLKLVAGLLASLPAEPTYVVCDKHGGRNRYLELLQGRFGDHLVEVRRESREASIYRWGPAENRVEICFRTCGEQFLPAALASMTAKYVRELSMRAFNAFWQAELPSLRPTAGYPGDAQRFRREIRAVQRRLKIPDRVLWRNR
jgi:ribonuclease HII